jgi:hypothetical protein
VIPENINRRYNSDDIEVSCKRSFDNYKRTKQDLKVEKLRCFQTVNNMVSRNVADVYVIKEKCV